MEKSSVQMSLWPRGPANGSIRRTEPEEAECITLEERLLGLASADHEIDELRPSSHKFELATGI